MSELKMSDVFALPVKHNIDVCKVTSEKGSILVSAEAVNLKHICHAINSHDNLVEQIAKLQAEKVELVAAIHQTIGWNESTGGCVEDVRMLHEVLNKLQ